MTTNYLPESKRLDKACATTKACQLWPTLTDSERRLVQFGLSPHEKMERAKAELIAAEVSPHDAGRLLAVALMELAERGAT